jgi:uncharacterized protein YqgV (UPF0045/DUF77 family)
VNPSRFDLTTDPGEDKRRYDIGPLDPTVLFCGRLAWQKGPDLLVEAIPSVLRSSRNAKFIFVGDGDMRSGLETRVRQLGVTPATRFLGRCDGEELVRLFKLADMVCMPSACKPVVVTQVGGPSEYVWHEVNGLKIEPNPNSVAWGLGAAFSDFERARWMGRNGRKAVEECFTWDKIVKQTLAVYKEACPFLAQPAQEIRELWPVSRVSGDGRRATRDGLAAPLDVLAELRLEVGHDGNGTRSPLTTYKDRLVEIGIHPEQENGSMILRGKLETLFAAIEHCHQQMHQAGLPRVEYSVKLQTSVPSSVGPGGSNGSAEGKKET